MNEQRGGINKVRLMILREHCPFQQDTFAPKRGTWPKQFNTEYLIGVCGERSLPALRPIPNPAAHSSFRHASSQQGCPGRRFGGEPGRQRMIFSAPRPFACRALQLELIRLNRERSLSAGGANPVAKGITFEELKSKVTRPKKGARIRLQPDSRRIRDIGTLSHPSLRFGPRRSSRRHRDDDEGWQKPEATHRPA